LPTGAGLKACATTASHWCRPEGLRYDRIALVQACEGLRYDRIALVQA
jgi:hypothetical protein